MNSKFDELAKTMGHTVNRRSALRQFGVGLAAMALACLGFAKKAAAIPPGKPCHAADCYPPCPQDMKCKGNTYYGCYCK